MPWLVMPGGVPTRDGRQGDLLSVHVLERDNQAQASSCHIGASSLFNRVGATMAPYDNSLWYIESNTHPLLASASKQPQMVNYIRPSFWTRFLELQRVMWETNAGLTERHAYDSRPLTWPVLRRGINFWTKDHRQIYLIGNPFIWYASLCAIMVYLGARAILMLRAKRGHRDFQDCEYVTPLFPLHSPTHSLSLFFSLSLPSFPLLFLFFSPVLSIHFPCSLSPFPSFPFLTFCPLSPVPSPPIQLPFSSMTRRQAS